MTACFDDGHVTHLLERCEAIASDFAAIEPATQGMYVRCIDHDEIFPVAAGREA